MPKRKSTVSKEAELKKILLSAQLKAARRVEGLFLPPDHPNYNPDAELTKREARMSTIAAIDLAKGSMATERAKQGAITINQQLNMVPYVPRVTADKWNQLNASDEIVIEAEDKPDE